jgi:hypothetical protein
LQQPADPPSSNTANKGLQQVLLPLLLLPPLLLPLLLLLLLLRRLPLSGLAAVAPAVSAGWSSCTCHGTAAAAVPAN